METKLKDKGEIRKSALIIANGIQFLNGEIQSKNAKVPVLLLDYMPPTTAHPYAQGERFKLWIKLEDAQYQEIVAQLKKGLREISIWFDAENKAKIKSFLEAQSQEAEHG